MTRTGTSRLLLASLALTGCTDGLRHRTETTGSVLLSHELYNEPANFRPVAEFTFDDVRAASWEAASTSNLRLARDESAPMSPPQVGEAVFPARFRGGYEPMWLESDISSLRLTKLYVSLWVKVSPNWQGHDSHVNKVGYVWTHRKPVVFLTILGNDDGPLVTRLGLQDLPEVVAKNLEPNLATVNVERGHWLQWEVLLLSNTPGRADGEAHWWIDGVKVGEYEGLRYAAEEQMNTWERLSWRPVWGGGDDEVEETMFMWLDHYYASGSR